MLVFRRATGQRKSCSTNPAMRAVLAQRMLRDKHSMEFAYSSP